MLPTPELFTTRYS